MSKNILEAVDVSKVYPNGVYANKKVSFSVREGEIHALVGENGAGKTTLMKIIFGMERPDSGKLLVNGESVEFRSPHDALRKGIGMVHQHFMLVPSLTAAENIALGSEAVNGVFIDRDQIDQSVTELAQKYNLHIDVNKRVADITVGLKQRVEILKTLYRGAKLIILDEPTAVLTPQETQELFAQLKLLREKGHTIIFISHKLHEIKQITDRISVLRKGEMVATVDTGEVSERDISDLMIGESVSLTIEKEPKTPGEVVLRVSGLCAKNDNAKPLFDDLNMTLRAGQIVGLAGIEGNGQSELVEIITCTRKFERGSVAFMGEPLEFGRIRKARRKGLSFIPSDRMTTGSAVDMTIEENLIANKLEDKSLFSGPLLSSKKVAALSKRLVKQFDIRCKSPKTEIRMLSGGNIQKAVAAREFSIDAKLVIADQPTRGIDVLAADFIHKTLVRLRDEGAAVLLISADLDELLKVSDVVLVMVGGKLTGYFEDVAALTQMELGNYMLGVKRMERCYEE